MSGTKNAEKPEGAEKPENTEKPTEGAASKETKLRKQDPEEPKPADKPAPDAEDIEAKIREAVARERKKAIEETMAKLKAEADEKARLEKMEAAERLQAEKEKAEKETAAAKAEASAASRKLELYRGLTSSGIQPAADSAMPMIEQAFASELEGGADAAAALKAVRKNMPFLFKAPPQTEEKKPEEKKPMPGPQSSTTTIQSTTAGKEAAKVQPPDPKTAKFSDYIEYFEKKRAAGSAA